MSTVRMSTSNLIVTLYRDGGETIHVNFADDPRLTNCFSPGIYFYVYMLGASSFESAASNMSYILTRQPFLWSTLSH